MATRERKARPRRRPVDEGAGLESDATRTKLRELAARVETHAATVKAGQERTNAPEMAEYVKRWNAYVDEVKAAQERITRSFSWVTEDELSILEAKLRVFLAQWPTVALKIDARKNENTIAVLEELRAKQLAGVPMASNTELPPVTATAPPPYVPPPGFSFPDVSLPKVAIPSPTIPAWVLLVAGGGAALWLYSHLAGAPRVAR